MKAHTQTRQLQLIDKYLAYHETKIMRDVDRPLTGRERDIVVDVVQWMCQRYRCVPLTMSVAELTRKEEM